MRPLFDFHAVSTCRKRTMPVQSKGRGFSGRSVGYVVLSVFIKGFTSGQKKG